MKTTRLSAGLHAALVLLPSTIPAVQAADNARPNILEEIIVTAQRREASLQDTSISMTAFTERALAELGISNHGDIGDYTPNVTIHAVAAGKAGFAANIRGVYSGESLITFDPKVALYLDSVLIAKSAGSALDVVDLERVEVLRGPQGTLYGRNTVGGAISLITIKPRDEWGGNVSVTLGDYSQRDIKGSVNVPLLGQNGVLGGSAGSTLNLKVSLASLNRDGYWDNDLAGAPEDELDDRDRQLAHAQLQWQPSDQVSLLYAYDKTRIREAATPYFVTGVNPASPSPAVPLLTPSVVRGDAPSSITVNGPMVRNLDVEGHSLTADIDFENLGFFGGLTFTSITAYREMENTSKSDADGSEFTLLHTDDNADHEQFTQEFRLVGTSGNSSLDYVLGAFYMDEDGSQKQSLILDSGPALGIPAIIGAPLLSGARAEMENDIWAVYGQGTYHWTESLDLTVGIRYTEEERSMIKEDFLQSALIPGSPLLTPFPDADEKFDNVSPMVGLTYQWTEDLMVYGKISRGYQSGGFNTRATTAAAFVGGFDEETLTAYEVGLKSLLMEGVLQINGAVFYSDYTDQQVNVFDPSTAGNNVQNAADVTVRGLELEVIGQLSDKLSLGLSYGHTDPEYSSFIEPGTGKDLSNSNFPHTPENNVHTYARYVVPNVMQGDLIARVDWVWQDDRTFLVPAPEPNSQSAYSLLNARLTLQDIRLSGGSTFKVSLWGKNLTDENYRTTGVDLSSSFGYTINTFGAPRTYGLDISYEL